ncbi:MAG: glycosyltransferase [Acidobacteriota bacterium]
MRAPRRILFICDFNAHGGTQTHLLHLFSGLDRGRFQPLLATLNLHPRLGKRLDELEVPVHNLRLEGAYRAATGRAVLELARRVKREGAELLHGALFQGNILTAIVSTLSRVPCITSVRNLDLWKQRRHRVASSLAHRRASCVVFNSRRVLEHTLAHESIPRRRAVVIYNGIRLPAATPAHPQGLSRPTAHTAPTIICVASLTEKKGHRALIEAFREVRCRVPSARLLLAGEGPLEGRLRDQVESRGLHGAVDFLGFRSDIPALLAGSDVLVLASIEEGMPNPLLEAMACGVPAVATDVGGNGEVIEDDRTGYLVRRTDPVAMADRVVRLLLDEPIRRRMGEAARRRYEAHFTLDGMLASYHRLYERVLA